MTPTLQPRFISLKRLGISLGILVALIVLSGLLSYYWLPGYAKSQLEIVLSDTLQRPVTVALVEFKPHTLQLTVHGFRVGEKTGSPEKPEETLLSFDRLFIDLSSESITQRAPVISAITLAAPSIRLVRESRDQFNISDLVTKFTQPAEDNKNTSSQKALFSVSNIKIEGGRFELVDQYQQGHQEISEINLSIPFIANFDSVVSNWVEPHFSARINGAPFSLDGKLRPFTDRREATIALKLNDIDLTFIDQYAPLPAGITLLTGLFDSNLLLTFSQVSNESPSISLSGNTALRQLKISNQTVADPYLVDLKNAQLTLTHVDLIGQKPSHVALMLGGITISRKNENQPALSLAKFTIDNIEIDTKAQQIALGEIILDRFNTRMRREQTGEIDLIRLFTSLSDQPATVATGLIPIPTRKPVRSGHAQIAINPEEKELPPATQIAVQKTSEQNNAAWTTQIKGIKLKAAVLHYEDLALSKPAPMVIDQLDLTINNIDLTGEKPLNLVLQAQVNKHGSLKTNGSLAWAPFTAELNLDIKSIDLVSLQGWVADKMNVLLTSGDISFAGNIKANGEPLKIGVNGQAQLANFNVFNPKTASDLLRWKQLDVNQINFVNEPLQVDIHSIKLSNFFARVVILPEGGLNLQQIIRQDETVQPKTADADKSSQTPAPAEKPIPVHIGKVILQQGNIYFKDQFIKPNYQANLTGLSGQIGPLQSNKLGKIEILGAVDKTAPLDIRGTIDPFSAELLLDVFAKVQDIDLPPFSPYSGKYIGYGIEKGKLSVDVHYQIEKGTLTAENKVFLDQFALGEKIESDNAPSIPLELAITLLKNRRGEIDIHLPVQGSINDPQFNIGSIIFDAFLNLISKAITAPFALLGSVFSGGEELSEIHFAPGFENIEPAAEARLKTLSQILIDRPTLRLEIISHADPASDAEGLKLAILQRKIKALKLADDARKDVASGSLNEVTLTDEQYSDYLEIVYKNETFEKPKNMFGLTKKLPVTEMEQLMLANIEVTENDLRALAERRAIMTSNWLIEQGEIASDRVFIIGTHETRKNEDNEKQGNRVDFILK